ncbi:MAG: diguanylate cyclase domain-containing protein [Methylophilaceae bacterium]
MKYWSLTAFYGALKRNASILVITLVSFIFLLTILQRFVQTEVKKIEALNAVKLADHANNLKSQLNSELNALIYLSSGMSSFLTAYHDDLNPKKVEIMLATLYKDAKYIRSFGIATGYQMRFIYPLAGNEKALSLDYRKLPDQWPLVKSAIESREGVMAGPVNLVQGGSALIYRYPVYINDQYWGILSTVIDNDSLLKEVFSQKWNDGYSLALRVKSDTQSSAHLIYGDLALFDNADAFITMSTVPNATWEWAILQTKKSNSSLVYLAKLMAWVISILISSFLFFILKDRKNLKAEARLDNLTGLPNRQLLNIRLNHVLKHASLNSKLMAVMFIDLDYFKKINDSYGHDIGDEVLKVFSDIVSNIIRSDDIASRIGGDEFVILLNELNLAKDVSQIAESIFSAFMNPVSIDNHMIKIDLSIGIAVYSPNSKETARGILKKADIALYDAKSSGRNKYVIYNG